MTGGVESEISFMENQEKTTKFDVKELIEKVKKIDWKQNVNPVVAWSVFGGVVALSVIISLIVFL